jgi:preprotein translocase subunit SecD
MRVRVELTCAVAALALLVTGSAQAQAPSRVACKLVEFASVGGALPNSRTLPAAQGGVVRVSRDPIVASRELTGAHATVEGGETAVKLSFAPEAGQRMQAFTSQHLGEQIALIVDGRAMTLFTASGPVGGDGLQFSGMTPQAGDALAAGVNACLEAKAQ